MDVALELRYGNGHPQLLLQVLRIAMNEVIGPLIALIDQGIVYVDGPRGGVGLVKPGDIGVVLP